MALNFIEIIFFTYMFLGLYVMSILALLYIKNRKIMFDYPPGKVEGVSIVIPCYNESKTIGDAIESLLNLNYPKNKLEIIVVDDKSTDDSVKVIRRYCKKYNNVRLIVNSKNSGCAAVPTNLGIKAAKYDYVAVADADSMPKRDALRKMIGFVQSDEKVAAVTCSVLVRDPKNFIQNLQAFEYAVIAFSRKLLDMVDSVYVTPGPFALYRKDALFKVGLFDTKNLTQDIEIVWRLLSYGYKARMCLATSVYSEAPDTFKGWFKQRIRWNIGGTQTLIKYRKTIFKKGMLGYFIIPFFAISLFLGLIGLSLFFYLVIKRFIVSFLLTKYSVTGNVALIRMQDLTFNLTLLNYFGLVLFVLGSLFTFFSLYNIKDKKITVNRKNLNIAFYMLIYLTLYPLTLVVALYKMSTGRYSW
ncbi:MAG: glycosyltransferase family 2 protein [Candidatus Pacearchaeota archaeon]